MSKKNCRPANPGANNDPITTVDGLNDDHEDVNEAKSKASTTGMGKLGVSVAQSDTVSKKAFSTTDTVTDNDRTTTVDGLNDDHKAATDAKSKVSTIVKDEVGIHMNNDNDVEIATYGVNADDEDAKDKDESIAMDNVNEYDDNAKFEVIKEGMDEDENVVREVRLHSHRLHLFPPWLLS